MIVVNARDFGWRENSSIRLDSFFPPVRAFASLFGRKSYSFSMFPRWILFRWEGPGKKVCFFRVTFSALNFEDIFLFGAFAQLHEKQVYIDRSWSPQATTPFGLMIFAREEVEVKMQKCFRQFGLAREIEEKNYSIWEFPQVNCFLMDSKREKRC